MELLPCQGPGARAQIHRSRSRYAGSSRSPYSERRFDFAERPLRATILCAVYVSFCRPGPPSGGRCGPNLTATAGSITRPSVIRHGGNFVITKIDFVAIPSQDAERLRGFYADTLRLRPDPRARFEF